MAARVLVILRFQGGVAVAKKQEVEWEPHAKLHRSLDTKNKGARAPVKFLKGLLDLALTLLSSH